jgi:hypothetical protein
MGHESAKVRQSASTVHGARAGAEGTGCWDAAGAASTMGVDWPGNGGAGAWAGDALGAGEGSRSLRLHPVAKSAPTTSDAVASGAIAGENCIRDQLTRTENDMAAA